MTINLPALRPACRTHGPMSLRPGWTSEQRWCGTWYECTSHRCGAVTLIPSPELQGSLEKQRSAAIKAAA